MRISIFLGAICAAALMFGTSAALNVIQLRTASTASLVRDKEVVTTALEAIRRRGTIFANNTTERTIGVEYQAEVGTSTKRMELILAPNFQAQRIHAKVDETGVITGLEAETIFQKDLVLGEPIYVVTKPTVPGQQFETSLILVGDILPR